MPAPHPPGPVSVNTTLCYRRAVCWLCRAFTLARPLQMQATVLLVGRAGATMSEERTLYLTPTRSVPQVFPDGIPISIARSQIFPSMKNEGMHDYHLD